MEILAAEPADAVASATSDAPAPLGDLPFRPELFFLGPTEGAGVVRDPFGRVARRCRITTIGEIDQTSRTVHFDETFTFDDGEVDVWRWVMQAGRDGRYVAAEQQAGSGIIGEQRGADYHIAFRRPIGRLRGAFSPAFATRFTLLAPDLALKVSRVNLLGLPVGVLTAFHRRIIGAAH